MFSGWASVKFGMSATWCMLMEVFRVMKIVAVIAAIGLILLSQHSFAGPREDAQAAFEGGDYVSALAT